MLTYSPGKITELRNQIPLTDTQRTALTQYSDIKGSPKQKKQALKQLANVSMPCWLEPGLFIAGDGQVRIQKGVFANHNLTILADADITIGRGVFIGPNAVLCSYELQTQEITAARRGGITIEENAWIGANAVILSGVTIGMGAIVAAGAVVNQPVPSHSVFMGAPAEFKRWVVAK
nr:DapH/DapD/GlmU-related protein [Aestuariibacter sp. A3R04]